MDPQISLQDVIRCQLCERPVPSKHCEICHIHLCEACVEEHLSNKYKEHYILPFQMRGTAPKCEKHSTKIYTEICIQCDIPICELCVLLENHEQHKRENMMENKKRFVLNDLQEIENFIYPLHQEALSNIQVQKAEAIEYSQKLTSSLNEQREALHKEVDTIIKIKQAEIDEMESKHLAAIEKQETAIQNSITEITDIIQTLKSLQNDLCFLTKYKSRIEEFLSLPALYQVVTLPTFTPSEINREQLYQMVGHLSEMAIMFHIDTSTRNTVADIKTKYGGFNGLRSVTCLSDSEFWTHGDDKFIRLYNLQGKILKSFETKSGNFPLDVAVTVSGNLVYTDPAESSICLVSNGRIKTLVELQGWRPRYLCCTSANELLVIMDRFNEDETKETKVVRYNSTCSKVKQSIQWDKTGQPLYSSGYHAKNIVQNRNFDICVADFDAGAVVVVSAAGKLRFRYTAPLSPIRNCFSPYGITTDSNGNILTVDFINKCIHILDRDGHFLQYLNNYSLKEPCGLNVDSRDNLFVAEFSTGKVKKIKYYK
uniref:Uncharacterized protein LOC111109626 n=1 Tax=Crassostrea virginica TaxID=6565 RepID=A0A8B8BDQ8_CRAVI|nr:uncharacterized protein LOC111109626 [Crassostrea virginica]